MITLPEALPSDATAERLRSPGSERAAWIILAILLLFSIAAPLNQFKVPPVMPLLMGAFHQTVGTVGLLMSVFALTGVILALPSGLIFQKAGYRITGLLAGGSIVLGSVLGALSNGFGMLLVSRIIEGVGTSFMAVLAPAIIAQRFMAHRRGTAMGIWSIWVPVGTAIMVFAAPALAQAGNSQRAFGSWRAVWWAGAAYGAVVSLVYLAAIRPAPRASAPALEGRQVSGASQVTSGQVLRNSDIWLLALAFCCFNLAFGAFATFMPTYLYTVRGLPLARAALLGGVATFVTIFSCPVGGLVSDRVGSRKMALHTGAYRQRDLVAPERCIRSRRLHRHGGGCRPVHGADTKQHLCGGRGSGGR